MSGTRAYGLHYVKHELLVILKQEGHQKIVSQGKSGLRSKSQPEVHRACEKDEEKGMEDINENGMIRQGGNTFI